MIITKSIVSCAIFSSTLLMGMEVKNSFTYSFTKKIESKKSDKGNYTYFNKERGISVNTHKISENLYYRREEQRITSLYDQNEKKIFTFEEDDNVYALAYNPEKKLFAYNNKKDKKEQLNVIFIMNQESKETESIQSKSFAEDLIISNDGKYVLVVPSSKPIMIFDIETNEKRTYQEPINKDKDYWMHVDCNADFTFFAAINDQGSIYIYSIENPQNEPIQLTGKAYDLQFSAHDNNLVALCYGIEQATSAKIWDINKKECIKEIISPCICAVAWHPNGRILATGDGSGSIKLWDWENRTLLETLYDESFNTTIISLNFNKEGDWIMARDIIGSVAFWNKK